MLTPETFVTRAVGVPWARWRADWQAMDCFGLVMMWHREVLGIDLGAIQRTTLADGFASSDGWQECGANAGTACFMSWRDGSPTHCGVVLSSRMVLHSIGDEDRPGSVRVSRLAAMRALYADIRFYRRATTC